MEQIVPFAAMFAAKATRAACQAGKYASTVKKVGGKFSYTAYLSFSAIAESRNRQKSREWLKTGT
jgi:hypothetical protein